MTTVCSAKIMSEAQEIAAMLSDRMEVLEARIVPDKLSDGYEDDQWNGRLLIALKLRDEFKTLLDVTTDILEQENDVLRQVEERTSAALAWDETGYFDLRDENTSDHYLLDVDNSWLVRTVLSELPKVSDAQRAAALAELR